jgi:hypothetical protein
LWHEAHEFLKIRSPFFVAEAVESDGVGLAEMVIPVQSNRIVTGRTVFHLICIITVFALSFLENANVRYRLA